MKNSQKKQYSKLSGPVNVERLKETLENLSKAVFEKQFRLDYEQLNEQVQTTAAEAIKELVEEYRTNPWNHPQVKYIPSQGKI